MSIDPVDVLNRMRGADEVLCKAMAAEIEAARLLADGVERFGPDRLREHLGNAEFDRLMRLARRREELGEEQLILALFRERKVEDGISPERN
jgi:hypothetical protein